ncbi:MAG: outer membrane beta-barrel protein [Bacteroidota bacterium]
MKKVLITAVLAISLTLATSAQEGFAAKAGFNLVTINVDTPGFFDSDDSELGVYFGGGYNFEVSEQFDIEPSLLFSIVDELTSLYIPIMGKYIINDQFSIQAGPQINYLLEDLPDGEFGLDLAFGGAYNIDSNWFVEARYGLQISRGGDFGDLVDINTLTFGGGYRFD